LVCAVEPSAFNVPVEQTGAVAAGALESVVDGLVEVPVPVLVGGFVLPVLPLLLQAASAIAPAMSPAATPVRLSFTLDSPSSCDM
jgi:hypothetical protein